VETALPTDTVVSAKRVIETGSPITRSQRLRVSSQNSESSDDTLKERTASAVSEISEVVHRRRPRKLVIVIRVYRRNSRLFDSTDTLEGHRAGGGTG